MKLPSSLYKFTTPVYRENEFFGRLFVRHRLRQALLNYRSVGLSGQFRIGTSSLLLYIQEHILKSLRDNHTIPIYYDLSRRPHVRDGSDFFARIWKLMSQALVNRGETQATLTSDMDLYDPFAFDDYLEHWVNMGGYHFIFLLDEFGVIARNKDFDQEFFDNLRGSIPALTYVFTTPRRLSYYERSDIHSSPLWNELELIHLKLFEEREWIQELIHAPVNRVGLDWSGEAESFIYERGGQHPCFIQMAASALYDTYHFNQGQLDYDKADRTFHEIAVEHFRYLWTKALENRENPARKELLQVALLDLVHGHSIDEDIAIELADYSLIWYKSHTKQWEPLSAWFANWLDHLHQNHRYQSKSKGIIGEFSEPKEVVQPKLVESKMTGIKFPLIQGEVIKILFLTANPLDTSSLRLNEEIHAIDHALQQAEYRDKFDIAQHWAVRSTDLQSYLLRHKPHIVHFSGHGSAASEIILEDEHGNSHPVSVQALSRLFSVLKENVRCVILNACYSESQAQAIAQHIEYVVGLSQAIREQAAISFAMAFYQALGFGKDVRTAFELGCNQIDLRNLGEQDVPKLITFE